MLEQAKTVSIARPVCTVFAFLADPENETRWRPRVLETIRIGGEGVGATYRQVVGAPRGRRIEAAVEITALVPDERIELTTSTSLVRTTGTFDLRPIDNGTELSFRLAARLFGPEKLITPVVAMVMSAQVDSLHELTRVLEGRSRVRPARSPRRRRDRRWVW